MKSKDKTVKELIVYGAGIFGSELLNLAAAKGRKVLFFIDKHRKGKIGNTPILTPDDFEKSNVQAPVFVALKDPNEEIKVIGYLKSLNSDLEIRGFKEMLLEFPELIVKKYRDSHAWLSEGCFDPVHVGCEGYFSEVKSREIAKCWMKFRETLNPAYYVEPQSSQYVPDDLNWIKKLDKDEVSFLDIGAYTGDTYEFFIKKFHDSGKNISDYFAFEVDQKNFIQLGVNIRSFSKKYPKTQAMALPLGIWNDHGLIHMSSDGSSTQVFKNAARDETSSLIPAARLDDLFLSMPVDVIKMDIEGSEKEALAGAENIIREHSPVLLISLYHKPEDLWKIPALINGINPNYDMYIRVHAHLFIETVLYCVPKQGLKRS